MDAFFLFLAFFFNGVTLSFFVFIKRMSCSRQLVLNHMLEEELYLLLNFIERFIKWFGFTILEVKIFLHLDFVGVLACLVRVIVEVFGLE